MKNFYEYLKKYTENKNVCILGFGREGKSTYKIIAQHCSCKSLTIADLQNINRAENNIPDSVNIVTGDAYQDALNDFDIVFKSPGIVLKEDIRTLKCEISSETEVFFTCFREQIIGITGTKGKSTVSSLLYHILKKNGVDCRLAGNIGIPVFDIADTISDETIIVCELSCHQLEYMTVSPHIAVMLNIYEEHLDHYGTMEKYIAAKNNIYLNQTEDDIYYCNYDIIPSNTPQQCLTLSNNNSDADIFVKNSVVSFNDYKWTIPQDKIKLLGIHNHYNIAVVYAICKYIGLDDVGFENALCNFNPLAHRLEFVAEINGIRYYDDSISTACATAIEAIKSVPNPGTILIGGMDRGIDYTELIDYLNTTDINIICMEASGKRIFDLIQSVEFNVPERVHFTDHLDDAVDLAAKITKCGQSCILSPAAASYGIFKNFEERGDEFKKLVYALKN